MLRSHFLLMGIVFMFFLDGCISSRKLAELKQEEENKMKEDSTGLISTHPSRPFKYGYAHTLEECEEYRRDFEDYNIKSGDVIASVGAASGWIEGIYSTMTDSVTFYIQDIDTTYLNEEQFNAVVKHYSGIRKTPQTNQFFMVIGTGRSTDLPFSKFNKIIISNAFHEIYASGNAISIIKDLTWKLLPDGKIIITDESSSEFKSIRHAGCEMKAEKTQSLIDLFSMLGFYLTGMTEPQNSFENDLIFEMNKERSDSFYMKRASVDVHVRELDKMNLKSVYKDSLATKSLARSLKPQIKIISQVYPSLEFYLYRIGEQLLDEGKLKEAINIMQANVYLFPESFVAYEGLGDAYCENANYELARDQYRKALSINPKLINYNTLIKEIEENYLK